MSCNDFDTVIKLTRIKRRSLLARSEWNWRDERAENHIHDKHSRISSAAGIYTA